MAKTSGGTRHLRVKQGILIDGIRLSVRQAASRNIASIIDDINRDGFSRNQKPFNIGRVERRMREFAQANNIPLGSQDIYMSAKSIAHIIRDQKDVWGKRIDEKTLIDFPLNRNKMDLYYEKDKGGFVYFDGSNKFILDPNHKIDKLPGKPRSVWLLTAQKASPSEFNLQKYIKI